MTFGLVYHSYSLSKKIDFLYILIQAQSKFLFWYLRSPLFPVQSRQVQVSLHLISLKYQTSCPNLHLRDKGKKVSVISD